MTLFCAFTTIVIAVEPTPNEMFVEGCPDVTCVPLTVTVAVGSATVGVTVMLPMALLTLSVNAVGTVVPCARPALVFTEARLSLAERASLMAIV